MLFICSENINLRILQAHCQSRTSQLDKAKLCQRACKANAEKLVQKFSDTSKK